MTLRPLPFPPRPRKATLPVAVHDVLVEQLSEARTRWHMKIDGMVRSGYASTPEAALIALSDEVSERPVRFRITAGGFPVTYFDEAELPAGVDVLVSATPVSWMLGDDIPRVWLYVSPTLAGTPAWAVAPLVGNDGFRRDRVLRGTGTSIEDAWGQGMSAVRDIVDGNTLLPARRSILSVSTSPKLASKVKELLGNEALTRRVSQAQFKRDLADLGDMIGEMEPPTDMIFPDGPIMAASDGSAGHRSRGSAWVTELGTYWIRSENGASPSIAEARALRSLAKNAQHPTVAVTDSRDALRSLTMPARVGAMWVRGHAGNLLNETADRLAVYVRRCRDVGIEPVRETCENIVTEMLAELSSRGVLHPSARPMAAF